MKKKMFKRAGVAVLSMAMLLSMGAVGAISASAYTAGQGGLEVTTGTGVVSSTNLTITAYKVATVNNSGNWAWDANLTGMNATDMGYLTAATPDANNIKTVADKLAAQTLTGVPSVLLTLGTENTTVPEGYYLILAQDTSASDTIIQPMLKQVIAGEKATVSDPKVTKINMDKIISSVSGKGNVVDGSSNNVAHVAEDDIVNYTLKTTFPIYSNSVTTLGSYPFKVTDTYDAALTVKDTPPLAVYVDTDGTAGLDTTSDTHLTLSTDYTFTNDTTNHQFVVQFLDATVLNTAYRGKDVYITFSAQFDAPATPNTGYEYDNTAKVSYDNTYTATATQYKEESDDADVYSVPLKIFKTDGTNPITAVHATFQLTDGTNTYSVTTDGTGYAKFPSLNAGTYTLSETAAPLGYKKIDGDIGQFKIEVANNGTVTVSQKIGNAASFTPMTAEADLYFNYEVVNEATEGLPGTGGMGTIMFTVGGAAIVLCAGFMFVIYMRKRRAEEE